MAVFKVKESNLQVILGRLTEYLNGKQGEFTIEVKKVRKIRSNNQNSYYHGVVLKTIALECGMEDKELHDYFKNKFNSKEVKMKNGDLISYGRTTTGLDTLKFNEYIDKIREWSMETLNCYVPLPNEIDSAEFIKLSDLYSRRYYS